MKSVLAVVLAVALVGLGAHGASAQVPYVQAYFSVDPYTTAAGCPAAPLGTVFQDLYVVTHNYNNFLIAIEYGLSLPAELFYLGFSPPQPEDLVIGDPLTTGVAVSWGLPRNGFEPLLVGVVHTLWMCMSTIDPPSCGANNAPVVVLPNQQSGNLTAVTWPVIGPDASGIGMTSLICPEPVAAEQTSWGQIKALYEE
jgi:hypothetical protein